MCMCIYEFTSDFNICGVLVIETNEEVNAPAAAKKGEEAWYRDIPQFQSHCSHCHCHCQFRSVCVVFFWLLVEGHLMHSMHSWFILYAVSLLLQMLANSFLHAGAGGLQSPALQPAEGMVRRDRSRTEWVTTCTVHGAQCTVVFAVAAHFVHCCTTTVQLSLRIWLTGRKSIEFRAASEYWEKRVSGATHVVFAKGCNSHACSSLMLVYSLLGS